MRLVIHWFRRGLFAIHGLLVHLVYERTILALVLMFCLGLMAVMWQLDRLSTQLIHSAAIQGTTLYVAALEEFRAIYTSEVVSRLQPLGIEARPDYKTHQPSIPLPATLTIEFGKHLSKPESGLSVRLYSDYPFPWRHDGGLRDAFEDEALRVLRERPDRPFVRFDELHGKPVLRFMTADRMGPACVSCHNSHPQSPRTDWRIGDVRGVLEVIRPLDQVVAESREGLQEIFSTMLGLTGLGLVGLSIVIQKLRRTARELEQKVEERTAELSEAKSQLESKVTTLQIAEHRLLQQAQELARSNDELEQFAYVASHDLKEPLRMVASFTKLLARRYKGQLDAEADEFIAYAVDGTMRMQNLIDDLLAYSRLGRGEKSFTATNCETVLNQVLTNLQVVIEETGAEVTHDPLPVVQGEELRLTQLFQNLMSNAIKYRGAVPPRIHVSAKRQGGDWVFSVRDNGIGFDPQYADKIFLIFQRLHSADEYSGTGIGLATSKKIVQQHNGRIWAESQPGEGSTFYFTIPYNENCHQADIP